MNFWSRLFVVGMFSIGASSLVGCGGDVKSTVTSAPVIPAQTGNLEVYLQTNPAYFLAAGEIVGFQQINLAFKKIQIHRDATAQADSSGWVDIPLPTSIQSNPVDLTKYTVNSLLLVKTPVPPGKYKQIKIIFNPNVSGQIIRNYAIGSTPAGNGKSLLVNYPSNVTDGFLIPTEIEVKAGSTSWLGITMDLRSLFGMVDGTYIYRPVARSIDLNEAGNIELNIGANDGAVLVSVQRYGRIVRSLYAPKNADRVLLTQLPKTSSLDDSYQVVLSSRNIITQVIKNIPVNGGGQTTSMLDSIAISYAQNPTNTFFIKADKSATSEVLGVMGVELIQRLGSLQTDLAIVTAYTVSPISQLQQNSLRRDIAIDYSAAGPDIADYYVLPIAFNKFSDSSTNFKVRIDPDLNSSAFTADYCVAQIGLSCAP